MSCTFRYCLVVLSVFLIEVFLSSIWTSFGALSINNFICSSETTCKYEDNAWLLLFFICLCRFIELWVELHCRYLHTKSDKKDAVYTHQKLLYTMPVFLIIAFVLSCYLSYGPQFLLFGLCGGILMGIISAHVKFYAKMFHDKEISERQYEFILHLGRSTSLMLTCVLMPLAIRHYYGIFTTRLLLAILMANVIPLVMVIKAGSVQKIQNKKDIKSYVRYDSLVYDPSNVEPVALEKVENNLLNVLSPEEEYERDLQAAIDASIIESINMSEMEESERDVQKQRNQEQSPIAEKAKFETQAYFHKIEIVEDANKIENCENQSSESIAEIDKGSLEMRVTPTRFSWADFGAASDDSSDSPPPYSDAVIYGYHTVEIHHEPSNYGRRNISATSTSATTSSPRYQPISVQELDKIETLQAKPRSPRRKEPRSFRPRCEKDFEEYSKDYCKVKSIITSITSYPSILSVVYSNSMCLIYLASFPFMLYQLRVKQDDPRTETIEQATFYSLFFLGLCWHAILWFLYYFPKYIFIKYVFGLLLLGSSLLLYFLTGYVGLSGPLFGLGYGITSYLEKDLYAYFTKSKHSQRLVFNFRVVAAFLSLLNCAILPVLARFLSLLSVYSAVPFFVLTVGLFTVLRQKVSEKEQTLLPVKRKRQRNYHSTETKWTEGDDVSAKEPVDLFYIKEPPVLSSENMKAPVDDGRGSNTSSPRHSWGNWMNTMLMTGGPPQFHIYHDVLAGF